MRKQQVYLHLYFNVYLFTLGLHRSFGVFLEGSLLFEDLFLHDPHFHFHLFLDRFFIVFAYEMDSLPKI